MNSMIDKFCMYDNIIFTRVFFIISPKIRYQDQEKTKLKDKFVR